MEVTTNSTQETKELAYKLAGKIKKGDVLFLYGDLGSGKTIFVRYLTQALGSGSRTQSPTFVLVRKYTVQSGDIKSIYHVDLYRITSKDQVCELGLKELLDSDSVMFIEWPELVEGEFKEAIKIYFTYVSENSRHIKIQNV